MSSCSSSDQGLPTDATALKALTACQLYSDGRYDQCTSLISMSYPCGIVSPIPCNPSLFFKTSVGRLAL